VEEVVVAGAVVPDNSEDYGYRDFLAVVAVAEMVHHQT